MPSIRLVKLADYRRFNRRLVGIRQLDIFPKDYVKVVDAGHAYSGYVNGATKLFGTDAVLSSIPHERVTWKPLKPDEIYKVHAIGVFCTSHGDYLLYALKDIEGNCYLIEREGIIPHMRFKHYQDGEFELPIYDA